MRRTMIAAVSTVALLAMSAAALAQGTGGGNPTSGEGTSSGQAGRSGQSPGR